MKLYFLPFFATVISVAESSLRANVFAEESERELGEHDHLAVLASDADETRGRRLCDKKCKRKKRRKRERQKNRDKDDDDKDDDDDDDGGSGGKRLQMYCGECKLFP